LRGSIGAENQWDCKISHCLVERSLEAQTSIGEERQVGRDVKPGTQKLALKGARLPYDLKEAGKMDERRSKVARPFSIAVKLEGNKRGEDVGKG